MKWINEPTNYTITEDKIVITTEPNTDLWQRTFYGFRNDNAPGLFMELDYDFTLTVKTEFNSSELFDQCGVIIYQNSENWFKASIEYENSSVSRLGSVVTNLGYSDWASTDINASINHMWYRLSKRGQDFKIENSSDGSTFRQMRIFHMFEPMDITKVGIYACSPLDSSIKAIFTEFNIIKSIWKPHMP